ncbi:MAG: sugar ABC transporter permease [Actinomycetaceae bacterium]|nr:sugar ABC transporter permease [Actinomycetaceae bacterium]
MTTRNRTRWVDAAFLLPSLILFTILITIPAVWGIVMSATNSVGFGTWEWVGLANYKMMFSDPAIRETYLFTIGFAACTVIVVNVCALALALGLTSKIRGVVVLRTIYVVPMVVSSIIIAYVFNFLFSQSLPALGRALGIGWLSESILANPSLAWIGIVIVTAWQAIPGTLLIYIAGLLSVPEDVYEAARIDGAGAWAQFRTITLPLVAGYVLINVVLGLKNFLNAYDIIVGLTNGGPGTATRSVAMTIIDGFTNGDYAYQMANATLFFVFVIVLSILQLRLTRGKAALA